MIYEGVIYKFENKLDGNIYIGQTFNEKNRYKAHLHFKCKTNFLDIAINKFGIENFDYKCITRLYDTNKKRLKRTLDKIETYFIVDRYKCNVNKSGFGYNQTDGGSGSCGCPVSEKTKHNISIHLKGRKKPTRTDEHKHNLSLSCRGRLIGYKWINNGTKNMFVSQNELDYYLNNGYVIGKINNKLSDEGRKRIITAVKNSWEKRKQKNIYTINQ